MNGQLTITEITNKLQEAETAFHHYCTSLPDEQFFFQPEGKWSPAQQVKHLVVAANMSRLAFTLPRFIVRLIAGKPNRKSRSYEELVAKYKLKLEQGGRASGRFVPKPIPPSYGKEKLLLQFSSAMQRFSNAVKKNPDEAMPDNYLSPHPLLGKITLRELGYFTIHHTWHHLSSIQKMTGG